MSTGTSRRTLVTIAGAVALFTLLVVAVLALIALRVIAFEAGLLMLIALLGLYLGIGVLLAAYRFVSRLN